VCIGDLDDSAKIAAPEAVIGQVMIQNYGVEHAVPHAAASGYAVTKRANPRRPERPRQ